MKKIRIFLLLLLSLFTIASSFVKAEEDTFAGAKYIEEEIKEVNNLPYNVKHIKVHGKTSTSMTGYDADGYGGDTKLVEPGKLYDQQVNVMEVPSDENVRITTWAYLEGHKWTLNTVRSLILDYEAKHPGWKVIGAINGDFFDINGNGNLPYQTSGALVSGGEFYKTTTGNTIGFRNDGSVDSLVGNEKVERTEKMILSIYDDNGEIEKEFEIDKVNELPGDNESAVFYAYYGSDKKIIEKSVEANGYFVDKAELALPNSQTDFYGKGKITSKEAKTIGVGQFAIVSNNTEVNQYLDLNVTIRVQYKYVGAYENVNDITGGGTTIIENGKDSNVSLTDRAPRTVIGRKADGTIIMMVIDGRQSAYGMYGADRTELGAIMNYYGAVEAYNLDGGGSSTMIIRKDGEFVVLNSPSDGRERTDANAILIVVKDPEISVTPTLTTDKIKLDVAVTNDNGHDIDKLYIKVNNQTKLVEDGVVEFTDLNSNTEYSYTIEYKNTEGEMVQIVTSGKIKTYKQSPVFNNIQVIDNGEKYEIILNYTDPDSASSYSGASLEIDGKTYGYFFQGIKSVSKTLISEINTIKISTFVNIGDGKNEKVTITITDFTIEVTFEGALYKIFKLQEEYANMVYGK
jgi:hypothetical protein